MAKKSRATAKKTTSNRTQTRSGSRTKTAKTTTKPSRLSVTASPRRTFLGGVDPASLIDLLDNYFTDTGDADGSPYQRLYVQARAKYLKADGGNVEAIANLLSEIDGMSCVEDAMRRAGFLVGFECCRQLLLGELDPATLQDGAK